MTYKICVTDEALGSFRDKEGFELDRYLKRQDCRKKFDNFFGFGEGGITAYLDDIFTIRNN